jgi:tryptophan synthase alpha chain
VVLMGYLNPIERYGYAAFARDAAEAGVDGILLVDCPPEEMSVLRADLDEHGVSPVCLVAPTTTQERMEAIARQAAGYLYYVSFKGITGANRLDADAIAEPLAQLRRHSDLPLAVGFGIKDAASAAAVAAVADGVVIGSALVARLAGQAGREAACDEARAFLAPVRAAMDNKAP